MYSGIGPAHPVEREEMREEEPEEDGEEEAGRSKGSQDMMGRKGGRRGRRRQKICQRRSGGFEELLYCSFNQNWVR